MELKQLGAGQGFSKDGTKESTYIIRAAVSLLRAHFEL